MTKDKAHKDSCTLSVAKDKYKLSPFTVSLLSMDKRLRFVDIDDVKEDVLYIPTKHFLYLPCMLPGVEHEIAHTVDFAVGPRLVKDDWGFADLKVLVKRMRSGNHSKLVYQSVSRECRVRGIQSSIGGDGGSFLLENPIWKEFVDANLPYGKFNTLSEVIAWGRSIHNSTKRAWNKDRIRHEWSVRLDYIRDWMETR